MGMINQMTESMYTFTNMNSQNHMQPSTHTSNKPSHISTAEKVEVLYKEIDLYDKKMATIKDKIENETDDNKNKILQDTYDSFYKKWTKMHTRVQILNKQDDSDTDNN